MAAIEQLQTAEVSEENKCVLKEIMMKADEKNNEIKDVKQQNSGTTNGIIGNRTNQVLRFLDKKNWYGSESKPYPGDIPNEAVVTFVHQGNLPNGSKGAVVYADPNRKWLVAFHLPNNKVYVQTGASGPTDWNAVESQLDASGSSSSYVDPVTGATAVASIDGDNVVTAFV